MAVMTRVVHSLPAQPGGHAGVITAAAYAAGCKHVAAVLKLVPLATDTCDWQIGSSNCESTNIYPDHVQQHYKLHLVLAGARRVSLHCAYATRFFLSHLADKSVWQFDIQV